MPTDLFTLLLSRCVEPRRKKCLFSWCHLSSAVCSPLGCDFGRKGKIDGNPSQRSHVDLLHEALRRTLIRTIAKFMIPIMGSGCSLCVAAREVGLPIARIQTHAVRCTEPALEGSRVARIDDAHIHWQCGSLCEDPT